MLMGFVFYKVFWIEIYVDDYNLFYFVGICDKIKFNFLIDFIIFVN